MRKTRIHVDAALTSGQTIRLPEEIARHLVAVLRLRPGDPCWLFRGDGVDYRAELLEADKRGVVAMIHEASATPPASPLSITLIQGIARGEKMDLILQKATELGVDVLAPVFSQRSEVRLTGERLDKRMQHWQGVVRGACEQSGRGTMPRLLPACDLAQRMAETQGDDGLRVRLEPKAESGLTDIASNPPPSRITLLVGPEGGLSDQDHACAAAAGFGTLRLGPRVLRTETAGLAAIAAMQVLWGDLGHN